MSHTMYTCVYVLDTISNMQRELFSTRTLGQSAQVNSLINQVPRGCYIADVDTMANGNTHGVHVY